MGHFRHFFLMVFLVFNLSAFTQEDSLQDNLRNKFDGFLEYAKQNRKDTLFYQKLDRLNQLRQDYLRIYGFDDLYNSVSLMVAKETVEFNPQQSLSIFENNIAQAQKASNEKALQINYHELAVFFMRFRDLEKAADYYMLSSNYFRKVKDWGAYSYSLIDLGNFYLSTEQEEMAMYYYNKAKKVFEKRIEGDDLTYAKALYYNNIALTYLQLEKADSALFNFRIAFELRKKLKQEALYSQSYLYFMRVYQLINQHDSAVFYYEKALKHQQEWALFDEMVQTLVSLGDYYRLQGMHPQALQRYREAWELIENYDFVSYKADVLLSFGFQYFALNQLDSAAYYLHLADSMAILYNQGEFTEMILMALIELYEKEANYQKLSKYRKRYIDYLKETSTADRLAKEVQIQLLERKREDALNAEIQQRNKNTIQLQYLALLFLLLIIIITVFFVFRIRRKRRELQEAISHRDLTHSIISHDLRGPLSGVYSALDLLQAQENLSKEELLHMIKVSADTVKVSYGLLENLLEWSSYQTQKSQHSPEIFSPQECVNSVIDLLHENAEQKGIKFEVNLPNTVHVFADKNMVFTVLRNLVNNAIKYSDEDSKIWIDANQSGSFCRIKIKDQGLGMNAETIEKIRKTQRIVSKPGTKNEKGSGLGLRIVIDFILKNKGQYFIESEVGKGTTFTLLLPLAGN